MTQRQLHLTVSLLKLAKRLENEMSRLEQMGITVLPMEHAQIDVLNILLQVHGIHKNNDHADLLLEPVFNHLNNAISRSECVKQFGERVQELKQRPPANQAG